MTKLELIAFVGGLVAAERQLPNQSARTLKISGSGKAPEWAHKTLDDGTGPTEMLNRGAPQWAHDLLDAIWDFGSWLFS